MARKKVLITVKTYPTISTKYKELACTAGLLEEGSWIRLYPIPFRLLEDKNRYAKYEWIEADIERNDADPRPESYRVLNTDEIKVVSKLGTERDWEARRRLVLDCGKVYTNLTELIQGAHNNTISLATFKPSRILDFQSEKTEAQWPADKLEVVLASMNQGNLFKEHTIEDFKLIPKLPRKFYYKFEDDSGRVSRLMIEDWEIGALYWNCVHKDGEQAALKRVREKFFHDIAETKDLYLFLGTTREWHVRRALNPYVIVGVFYPPHAKQMSFL